eukprot:scaffold77769_cov56-Attheya_sp.AAC.1
MVKQGMVQQGLLLLVLLVVHHSKPTLAFSTPGARVISRFGVPSWQLHATATSKSPNPPAPDPLYYSAAASNPFAGSTVKDDTQTRITLTRYLTNVVQDRPELREMESLLLSVQMACKTISNLVHQAGINQLSTSSTRREEESSTIISTMEDPKKREKDLRMNSMKKLDQLSTTVLKNALRFTGKVQVVSPEKKNLSDYADYEAPAEHQPGVLIASAHDSKYVACFDPLDGSGNADAAICTGTIFGIFENNQYNETDGLEQQTTTTSTTTSSLEQSALESVLQPGNSLKAAGYCLYSSATILVLSLGDGTHAFTLDPQLNEFVLTHTHMMIPQKGNVYSCNEANALGWTKPLQRYVNHLKEERYALRYVGSMHIRVGRLLFTVGHPIISPVIFSQVDKPDENSSLAAVLVDPWHIDGYEWTSLANETFVPQSRKATLCTTLRV